MQIQNFFVWKFCISNIGAYLEFGAWDFEFPNYAPSKKSIRSPSLRVMMAFFQSGLFPYLLPNRFILPSTFEVLTWRTFTLKTRSMADWISILLASRWTSKTYWPLSSFCRVLFSVIQGLRIIFCGSFMMRVPLRSFQPLDGVKSGVDDLRFHRHLSLHNGGLQFQGYFETIFLNGHAFHPWQSGHPPLEIFSALQEPGGF